MSDAERTREDSLEHEHAEGSSLPEGLARFAPARRELLRRGSRFDIELVTMDLRGGGSTQREVIRHPGSVLVLPVLKQAGKEPQIVMIWNWRVSLERWVLELPAGTMHAGEDPAACAARELEEETGYSAGSLEFVRSFWVAPGLADERMHLFVARDLTPCVREMDADERIVVMPLDLSEVLLRIERGEIEDAKTMLAVALALGLPRALS